MKPEPFRLERYFAKHEFTTPYLLCSSDCKSMELRDLPALEPDAAEQFASLWLGYTESLGDPGLRQSIASLYDRIGAEETEDRLDAYDQGRIKANSLERVLQKYR